MRFAVVLAIVHCASRVHGSGIPLDPRLAGLSAAPRWPLGDLSYFVKWDNGTPIFLDNSINSSELLVFEEELQHALRTAYAQINVPAHKLEAFGEVYERKRAAWRIGTVEDNACWMSIVEFSESLVSRLCADIQCASGRAGPRILNFGGGDGFGTSGILQDPLAKLVREHPEIEGVYFEPDQGSFNRLKGAVEDLSDFGRPYLELQNVATTPHNIGRLLAASQAFGPDPSLNHADVVKVDIDSFDCAVLDSVLKLISASIVIIEVEHSVPPPLMCSRVYRSKGSERHVSSKCAGCSFSYAVAMLKQHGFSLLRFSGHDGAFVSRKVSSLLIPRWAPQGLPMDEFLCYQLMDFEDLHLRFGQADDTLAFFSYISPLSTVQHWFFMQSAEQMMYSTRRSMMTLCPDVMCSLHWFPATAKALSKHAALLREEGESLHEWIATNTSS